MALDLDELENYAKERLDSALPSCGIYPGTVLKLLAVVRAAQSVMNPNPEDPDYSLCRLHEALKELEK
jgi:hypothetical protein